LCVCLLYDVERDLFAIAEFRVNTSSDIVNLYFDSFSSSQHCGY